MSVKGMSKRVRPWGESHGFWPHHSARCLDPKEAACIDCYYLVRPHDVSRWRWRLQYEMLRRAGFGHGAATSFAHGLATVLASDPERFAPIIQFLSSYTSETR